MTPSVAGTLLPVFLVIALGAGVRRFALPGGEFWAGAERLTYYVLFPALLFRSTATIALDVRDLWPFVAAAYAAIGVMAASLLLLRPWLASGPAAFTSVFQGGVRWNSYIALSVALAFFGQEGLALGTVFIGVLIPFVNLLSVAVLVRHAGPRGAGTGRVLSELLRNPLVLACFAGLAVNASGAGLPPVLSQLLSIVGAAALPVGLMAVGAAMKAASLGGAVRPVFAGTVARLLVMPGLMWGACHVVGVEGLPRTIAVLFAAVPGSPAAFILAKQLGGDAELMAGIVTVQVLVSFVTLPAVMALAGGA